MVSSLTDLPPPMLAEAQFWDGLPAPVQSVFHFFHAGGFFMLLILLCSLLAGTVVIWKALTLRRRYIVPEKLAEAIEGGAANVPTDGSVLGRISRFALQHRFPSKADAQESVQANAREEVVKMETGIATLEVVITIAPLLGLIGTVKGLVKVFSNLGGDPAIIALGIAEALYTTVGGLAVAVPVVVAHSYFSKKIERFAVRMEVLVGKLLARRFDGSPTGDTGGEAPSSEQDGIFTPSPEPAPPTFG